jgi:hypothetical protein
VNVVYKTASSKLKNDTEITVEHVVQIFKAFITPESLLPVFSQLDP